MSDHELGDEIEREKSWLRGERRKIGLINIFRYSCHINVLFGSWWAMVTHLGWSLLGQSDKSDSMTSVDFPSDTIAQILYAAFLVFAVVLLLNMLIALLCNTYQRVEVRSDMSTRPFDGLFIMYPFLQIRQRGTRKRKGHKSPMRPIYLSHVRKLNNR